MDIIILSYLGYNLIVGIFLALNYYSENKLADKKQLWWLLLFPVIGLGKLRYKQRIINEDINFKEDWFIYKYMIKLNWGYIIVVEIISFLMVFAFGGLIGSGMDWGNNQENATAAGFGLLADIGMAFLFLLFLALAIFGFVVLFLIFIFIPKLLMKNIETETYRNKYLETKSKKQQ